MTLRVAKFAGNYFEYCSNIPQKEGKEQERGGGAVEGWKGSLLKPGPEGCH